MALQDAVLEIADAIDTDLADEDGSESKEFWKKVLVRYARQLRTAVKAAEGTAPNPITSLVLSGTPEAAALQNRSMIDAAREDMRRGRQTMLNEEQKETRMALAMGGPEDGTYAPIDPGMPTGARCILSGAVYELGADGFLHLVVE